MSTVPLLDLLPLLDPHPDLAPLMRPTPRQVAEWAALLGWLPEPEDRFIPAPVGGV